VDELYVIEKLWPNATALATAVSPEDRAEYPLVWTNLYNGKTRVFSTTVGHNNETVNDDRYLEFVTRGLLWAAGKLTDDGKAAEGYGPAK
jgi:type 1 glutamine amidotransferase